MSNIVQLPGVNADQMDDDAGEKMYLIARIEDVQTALDEVRRLLGAIHSHGNVEVTAAAIPAAQLILEHEDSVLNDVSCELRTRWGLTTA